MAALTNKQKDQIEAALAKHNVAVPLDASWDPDLVVQISDVPVIFHAKDRSITVGDKTVKGAGHKGAGFPVRMVQTAIEFAGPAPAPSKTAAPKTSVASSKSSGSAPPPPSEGPKMRLSRQRAPRARRHVEQNGKILNNRG